MSVIPVYAFMLLPVAEKHVEVCSHHACDGASFGTGACIHPTVKKKFSCERLYLVICCVAKDVQIT